MATFDEIRQLYPAAVPVGTDLVAVEKADGTPAALTLAQIAAYINGISSPTWQTDAAHGCYLGMVGAQGGITSHGADGVVTFDKIIWDTGFYTAEGTITIPNGVTKVQVVAQLSSVDADPILSIVKNADAVNPIVRVQGYGTYNQIVSPEIAVESGDILQIHCTAVTHLNHSDCFFNVRTIEKVA
jgi:hypothetical protein